MLTKRQVKNRRKVSLLRARRESFPHKVQRYLGEAQVAFSMPVRISKTLAELIDAQNNKRIQAQDEFLTRFVTELDAAEKKGETVCNKELSIEQRRDLIIKGVKSRAKKRFERGELTNPYGKSLDECIGYLQKGMYVVYEEKIERLKTSKNNRFKIELYVGRARILRENSSKVWEDARREEQIA